MSDTPSHAAGQIHHAEMGSRSAGFRRRHALMAIALFALWASSDLQGMRGFSFGAGTAPRMFGGPAAGAWRRGIA